MISKKASSKFLEYFNEKQKQQNSIIKNTDTLQSQLPSESTSIDNNQVFAGVESRPPSVIAKILKCLICIPICGFVFICMLGALFRVKIVPREGLIPVFMIAVGIIVTVCAKKKQLSGSTFKWLLYGTFVPIVSWFDVLNTGNKKIMKNLLSCLIVFFVYMLIFIALI